MNFFQLNKTEYPNGIPDNSDRAIVPNGGGILTTDWINPTGGVAAGWLNVLGTPSISTGNGFTGNAQKLTRTGTTVNAGLLAEFSSITLEVGRVYTVSFMYRSDGDFRMFSWVDEDSNIVDVPTNTGNATLFTFTGHLTTLYEFRFQMYANQSTATEFEVDEINIVEHSLIISNELNGAASDQSGNLNNLTPINSPDFTAKNRVGQVDRAMSVITASSQYATASGTFDITGTDARTICGFIKTTNNTGTQALFGVGVDGAVSGADFRFTVISGILNLNVGTTVYSTGVDISDGKWRHIAAVFSGTTLADVKIYIDNVVYFATGATAINTQDDFFVIGASPNTAARNYATCTFDDIRLYNRVLTVTELRALWRKIPDNDLYAYNYGYERYEWLIGDPINPAHTLVKNATNMVLTRKPSTTGSTPAEMQTAINLDEYSAIRVVSSITGQAGFNIGAYSFAYNTNLLATTGFVQIERFNAYVNAGITDITFSIEGLGAGTKFITPRVLGGGSQTIDNVWTIYYIELIK